MDTLRRYWYRNFDAFLFPFRDSRGCIGDCLLNASSDVVRACECECRCCLCHEIDSWDWLFDDESKDEEGFYERSD